MKIVDYQVISEDSTNMLQKQVFDAIKHGWQPLGGVMSIPDIINLKYLSMQAMVKYAIADSEFEFKKIALKSDNKTEYPREDYPAITTKFIQQDPWREHSIVIDTDCCGLLSITASNYDGDSCFFRINKQDLFELKKSIDIAITEWCKK